MAVLGREALDPRAAETKEVPVPEWGGNILIRKLSASEVPKLIAMAGSAFNQETKALNDPERMTKMLATGLYWSWVDEHGQQVLTDPGKDIKRLSDEPFEILSRLGDAINAFNGIGVKEATEEAKKNSEETLSDDFGTN